MSIFLTDQPNDAELVPIFKSMGNLAVVSPIPHGDFAFFGLWHNDEPIRVCGDRKKLMDLVNSMNTGRYIKQLQEAHESGFDRLFLVLEWDSRYGISGEGGLISARRGDHWEPIRPITQYKRVDDYLNELHWYMGVQVKHSHTPRETVRQVVDLYWMFQRAPEEHKALNQFYSPPAPTVGLYQKPSLIRRMSKELTGVGWEISKGIEDRFGSVREMALAGEKQWKEVELIGKSKAKKIVEEMWKDWRK